eukprot:12955080-Ditylum_brightwellii.AAC.1
MRLNKTCLASANSPIGGSNHRKRVVDHLQFIHHCLSDIMFEIGYLIPMDEENNPLLSQKAAKMVAAHQQLDQL